jgi:glycerol kinase
MMAHIVAIDQGTTGSTALVLDPRGRLVGRAYAEFTQYFPKPGWVEHDAEEIWQVSLKVLKGALRAAKLRPEAVAAIGITNQRETTVLWDRRTGKPLYRAIVWQDRRTADRCSALRDAGRAEAVRAKTGLVIDSYFSGTKLEWLLENVRGARERAEDGHLAFGTVDSWLVWKLSGGAVHATDFTNASRTLLFNIHDRRWDPELLELFGVPESVLPRVLPSAGVFAHTARGVLGECCVPIAGIAGDQQAALFGQLCVEPGLVKNTYGTGCFVLMFLGERPVSSQHGLVTTIACAADGTPAYALEGSVFVAGAALQWLRDGLQVLKRAADSEALARSVKSTDGVYMVPAFVGLGAPYWDPHARGAVVGLTRGTTRAHIARAALESIAYQSRDVIDAMSADAHTTAADGRKALRQIRVDGGASANDFLMQFQADQVGVPVDRPKIVETTALGAGFLAGLGIGLWTPASLSRLRAVGRVFKPRMSADQREELYRGWRAAVRRVLSQP